MTRPSALLLSIVASVVVAMLIIPAGPARGSEPLESLTVSYNTQSCRPPGAMAADERAPILATLTSVIKGRAVYQRTVHVGSSPGPFVATFEVPPGAYYIQAQQQRTGCIPPAGVVRVLLPGHPMSISVDLEPCCGDALAYSYVAGLVSPGLDVQIKRSMTAIACGTGIDESALQALQGANSLSRSGNAYYGELAEVENGTIVLELTDRDGKKAFVRLLLQPNGGVSISSTYKRMDANDTLFRQAATNGGTLFCPAS